jgi:C4-dicarboxylate-specific signal transduction histidine kinase
MNGSAQIVVAVGVLILLIGITVVVIRYARTIKVTVGKVEAEFRNNGGSSLRDAVDKLQATLSPLAATVADHEQRITALEHPKPRTPRKKAA